MGVYEIAGFLLAFLVGVGLGQVLKWPLRGVLVGAGVLLLGYYLLDPAGATDLARAWLKGGAAWVLGVLGYPPAWADRLFSPEGERVVGYIAQDLLRQLGHVFALDRSPAQALQALGSLGQEVVGRPSLGFVMGLLAGVR